jgi:zinc transport system substrate-binding protein
MRKILLASSILGLGMSYNAMAKAPSVAVDIAPLHSLVSQVMEGIDEPTLLIPAEASPHSYALKPSQAKALSDANAVFWLGEELTPWLEKALNNVAGSAEKVSLLDLAPTTYEFREGATFEGHAHHDEDQHDEHAHDTHKDEHYYHGEHAHHDDHKDEHEHDHHEEHHDEHEDKHHDHGQGLLDRFLSLFTSDDHTHEEDHHEGRDHHDERKGHDDHSGHDHEGTDPHAWLDPENAKAWIKEIKNTLSKLDPENAEKYEANAAKAIAELDTLISETSDKINNLGDIKFIVFHDAYQYFEKRFGISASGSISLGDAADPSPARVSEIRDTVKKLGVNCVFAEPQFDAGLVSNVFEESSVKAIGVMDPLGASIQEGNQHYANLIRSMVSSLSQCSQ